MGGGGSCAIVGKGARVDARARQAAPVPALFCDALFGFLRCAILLSAMRFFERFAYFRWLSVFCDALFFLSSAMRYLLSAMRV